MSVETLRTFLLYCSVLNYGFLILWALLTIFAHHWLSQKVTLLYKVTPEQFDLINVGGLTRYKSWIFFFNIIPCVVLHWIK